MTTIESGTAIGVEYARRTSRARSRSTRPATRSRRTSTGTNIESSRLSIKMRGGSLGHHQAFEKEERFSRWQSEEIGRR